MKTSLPEILDPKVRAFAPFSLESCSFFVNLCECTAQAVNEQVQCAQKTEKGLSGYVYNKQTGLVNKVRLWLLRIMDSQVAP